MVKLAVFFPPFVFPNLFPFIPQVPFFPVEGFSPQQIARNARDRAESAAVEKKNAVIDTITAPLAQCADEFQEAYNEYKVYKEMSSTLSKVSTKVRKDKETSKSLDKLEEQLKNGEFHAGRGARKLPGTQTVYYFKYSDKENGAVEVIAESNKNQEQQVIDNDEY